MTPKLYMSESSGVSRIVLLAEAALGLKLDYVKIDVIKGEQFSPEFLKLNPVHTLPTLVDENKVIFDSAAINIYLVEKYGKDKTLYPDDPYKKALVNQLLHFTSGVVFPTVSKILRPIMLEGVKIIHPADVDALMKVFECLEKMFEGKLWATGDDITLADFALIPIITSSDVAVPLDEARFPNIANWLNRAKKLTYYHRNKKGDDEFRQDFLKKFNA